MLFDGGRAVVEKMVFLQKTDRCFAVTAITKKGEDQQGKDRQGNELRHAGDHKGKTAAEEHIVSGQAHQPNDDLAVYHMDQRTGYDPAQILQGRPVWHIDQGLAQLLIERMADLIQQDCSNDRDGEQPQDLHKVDLEGVAQNLNELRAAKQFVEVLQTVL